MPIQRRWGRVGLLVGMLILSSCGGDAGPKPTVEVVPNTEIPVNAGLIEPTPDTGFLLTKGRTIGGDGLGWVTWSADGSILRTYGIMPSESGQAYESPLAFFDWNVESGEQVSAQDLGIKDMYGRAAVWQHHGATSTMITLNRSRSQGATALHVHVAGPEGLLKKWPIGSAEPQANASELLVLNPQGDTFATTSEMTTTIWTLTGDVVAAIPRADGRNRGIAWSPDGKRLAIGDTKGVVVVWDVAAQRQEQLIYAHPYETTSLTWSHDSRVLITAGDGEVRFWDPATATEVFPAIPNPTNRTITMVVGNPQHAVVAILSNDNTVVLWNLDTYREIQTLTVTEASRLSWSPTGDTLAITTNTGRIELWHRQ